jgi:sugar-specific transcriptional regulator TrmB
MSDEIRKLIDTMLSEIEEEAGRLRRALEHLEPRRRRGRPAGSGGRRGPKASGRPPAKAPRLPKAKRAARGERQRQLVDAIKKMPGASPGELADAIEVGSTQAHQMIRSLEGKGEIKKKGQGFKVVA